MARIELLTAGFYRVPLPETLTDSTHGEMRAFELNTVSVRDTDGAVGVGYTFTVGRNGAAIDAILARELPELVVGEDAGPDRAAVAETLVGAALWWPRRADGAGDLGLRHGAVGPQGEARRLAAVAAARRLRSARALLCRRHRPAAAAGCAAAADRPESRARLSRDQDEGRPAGAGRGRRAGRGDAPASGRRLPAHARREHAVDGGPGAARGPGVRAVRSGLARGAGGARGPARPRARGRGGRRRRRVGREPAQPVGLSRPDHAGQGRLSRSPTSPIAAASPRS